MYVVWISVGHILRTQVEIDLKDSEDTKDAVKDMLNIYGIISSKSLSLTTQSLVSFTGRQTLKIGSSLGIWSRRKKYLICLDEVQQALMYLQYKQNHVSVRWSEQLHDAT